jgi:DNA mismatch repair protein MutL
MLHALSEAYRHILPEKRYPMAFVFLTLPPQDVDVNVHPHKTEVRFAQPELVHALVREAIQRGLSSSAQSASGVLAEFPPAATSPAVSRAVITQPRPMSNDPDDWRGMPTPQPLAIRPPTGPLASGRESEGSPLDPTPFVPTQSLRPLGQIHHSFIVADGPDGLYVFDQHALQERILYEILKAGVQADGVLRQQLLFPATIELTPAAMAWFGELQGLLKQIGFEAEPFGGTTVVLRTVPAVLADYAYLDIYRDTLATLATTGRTTPYDEIVEEMLASMACHKAIKINRPLDLSEMRRLLDEFTRVGAPATCPHGRPLALTLSIAELRRRFHRS